MNELLELMNLQYRITNKYLDHIWLGTYNITIWAYDPNWGYSGGYN